MPIVSRGLPVTQRGLNAGGSYAISQNAKSPAGEFCFAGISSMTGVGVLFHIFEHTLQDGALEAQGGPC